MAYLAAVPLSFTQVFVKTQFCTAHLNGLLLGSFCATPKGTVTPVQYFLNGFGVAFSTPQPNR